MSEEQKADWRVHGRWTPLIKLENVPVHVHLLPSGQVLYWGRRADPTINPQVPGGDPKKTHLDEHFTKSFLWTPAPGDPDKDGKLGKSEPIKDEYQPMYFNPRTETNKLEKVNLFCSGHNLLPSGNLLVVGGHWKDGFGVEQTSIFDYNEKRWIPQTPMKNGRWYPSVLTMPDGRALCISGSDNVASNPNVNSIPQIFPLETSNSPSTSACNPVVWTEVSDPVPHGLMLDLFPRLHIHPKSGDIIMVGPKPRTWALKLKDANSNEVRDEKNIVGQWKDTNTERRAGACDYAPSVMYESGKIMYIGGGALDKEALKTTEFLDLNEDTPLKWNPRTVDMRTGRRQFNATVLPDGSVLVTGGSIGADFNTWWQPAKKAELMMNPSVDSQWDQMAEEAQSRCYHSTALLLPDGRVFSGGGGEYGGCPASECHADAQLFEPPYLHRGTRPTIESVPHVFEYNARYSITVGANDSIQKVSFIRLGSVTHCRNMSQQLIWLEKGKQNGPKVPFQSPLNPNIAQPGHYMLFVLNKDNVPSEARIIQLSLLPVSESEMSAQMTNVAELRPEEQAQPSAMEQNGVVITEQIQPSLVDHNERVIQEQSQPHVTVGLTPLCPYGLGPCWGGAHDGLQAVSDVDVVRPAPHHTDCLAFVYLKDDIIPDIDVWRTEFESVANKGYKMRGIEMTISGKVIKATSDGKEQFTLVGNSTRPDVVLAPFQASSQLAWDIQENAPRPITDAEAGAYEGLVSVLADHAGEMTVQVTGTLQKHGSDKFSLDVREFMISG